MFTHARARPRRSASRSASDSGPTVRESASTALIALVSTAFGVVLVQGAALVGDIVDRHDPGTKGEAAITMAVIAWIFIGIGTYSAAVVTANTYATVVAGRLRAIARLRLLGASATSLRRGLARAACVAGGVGALVGLALGVAAAQGARMLAVAAGLLPVTSTAWFAPAALVPAAVAILTVVGAAWAGTRQVARVSPVAALSAHLEAAPDRRPRRRARLVTTCILLGLGTLLLALGVVVGLGGVLGLPIAFLGGVLHATGIIVGAPFLVPGLVDLVARPFVRSPVVRLARAEASRAPLRTARATIGMVIGVALVVMFVVALATMRTLVLLRPTPGEDPETVAANAAQIDLVVLVATAVMVGLAAVSAILAAIGMIATAELRILQRRRELGLLRAVAATRRQVRTMTALESCLESAVAVGLGSIIGILYGWAGANAGFADYANVLIGPTVPVGLLAAIIAAAALVGVAASVSPARLATRSTPVEALTAA